MKSRLLIGAWVLALATPVSAMPVQLFLAKAESLQKKGPFALFSGDFKLLMAQIKADAGELRTERIAERAAGRTPAYCPPAEIKLTNQDVLGAMQAVPAAERATTHTKDALRAYFARRFPCPA